MILQKENSKFHRCAVLGCRQIPYNTPWSSAKNICRLPWVTGSCCFDGMDSELVSDVFKLLNGFGVGSVIRSHVERRTWVQGEGRYFLWRNVNYGLWTWDGNLPAAPSTQPVAITKSKYCCTKHWWNFESCRKTFRLFLDLVLCILYWWRKLTNPLPAAEVPRTEEILSLLAMSFNSATFRDMLLVVLLLKQPTRLSSSRPAVALVAPEASIDWQAADVPWSCSLWQCLFDLPKIPTE